MVVLVDVKIEVDVVWGDDGLFAGYGYFQADSEFRSRANLIDVHHFCSRILLLPLRSRHRWGLIVLCIPFLQDPPSSRVGDLEILEILISRVCFLPKDQYSPQGRKILHPKHERLGGGDGVGCQAVRLCGAVWWWGRCVL